MPAVPYDAWGCMQRVGVALLLLWSTWGVASDAHLAPGSGLFMFAFVSGGEQRQIPVWYHRPERAGAEAPVVFVLHGTSRTAETYRRQWAPHAERQGFIVLAPEFSRHDFPGRTYNLGGMRAGDGTPYPEAEWSYSAIENIFDAVRAANGLSASTYDLYGHSAGGQFVHRLVFFKPRARYRVAIAANSGWYGMPDFDVPYPYGLAGSRIDRLQVVQALQRRLIVLLGGDDNDPEHHQLLRTPEAMAQGDNRLERGQAFFERGRRAAAELNVPFAWSIEIAPGVAHSNSGMAPFAARHFPGGSATAAK